MFANLKETLNKFISNDNSPIILSISGGVDSIVLLNILIENYSHERIHLVHFNFNKHKESNESERLICKLGKKYNCKIKSYNIDIEDSNFESSARKIRYEHLESYSQEVNSNIILTAHHKDDQIETLIMNDICDSSWISFLGIRGKYKKIVRPMLGISKEDIYKYAKHKKLKWHEDNTNNFLKYRRNFIRYKLKNKYYSKNYIEIILNKHYNAQKKIDKLKDKLKKNNSKLLNIKKKYIEFNSNTINEFDVEDFKIIMKSVIYDNFRINISLSKKHWKSFVNFFLKSNQGTIFELNKDLILLKDRKSLILYKKSDDNINDIKLKNNQKWFSGMFKVVNSTEIIDEKKLNFFSCNKEVFNNGLYVSTWKHGDYINFKNHKRKISNLFINSKISNYHKCISPIVRNSNGEIVWIPNLSKGDNYGKNDFNILWIENE